jgi:hypothetical protein
MAKKIDPLKAKQKRQKILAAVLGVAFLGLLAFQVPRVMKMMKTPPPPHASDSATATTAAPPTGTPSLAAPSLSGSEQPSTTGSSGSLAASDTAAALSGQLASFSRFASKDPFSQQVSEDTGSYSSGGSTSGGSGGKGGTTTPQVPSTAPRPGSAVISVNGTLYTVATNSDFPQPTSTDPSVVPLFHLISLTATTAKISIVGGSYSSGAAAVTLRVGKPVTLMNTADGTRYTLVLKPLGTAVPTGTSTSSSGTGSTTAPTSTTPTTVTLPSTSP